jgi:hypothetical protein
LASRKVWKEPRYTPAVESSSQAALKSSVTAWDSLVYMAAARQLWMWLRQGKGGGARGDEKWREGVGDGFMARC